MWKMLILCYGVTQEKMREMVKVKMISIWTQGHLRPERNSNVLGEDFRSLLTNSRENSEVTIEMTRMISEETSNQVSRRLNEIKDGLSFQIQDAIPTAIAEKVLPSIQNTLNTHGGANFTAVDRESNWLQEGPRTNNFTVVDRESNWLQKDPRTTNFTVVDRCSNGLQESLRRANFTVVDRRSSGLRRSPQSEISHKWRKNHFKRKI